MFESRKQKLLPRARFAKRVVLSFALAAAMLFMALAVGIAGYHFIARLRWIDSLLNAAMILTGMGPVDTLKTDPAKVFASGYALFSGLVFITVMAVVLAPVIHRALHKFHVDADDFGGDA